MRVGMHLAARWSSTTTTTDLRRTGRWPWIEKKPQPYNVDREETSVMEGSTSKRGKLLQIGLAEEACERCKLHAILPGHKNSERLAQDYEQTGASLS